MNSNFKYLSCDFETTVYEGQKDTEVWAAACVELFTEDVFIFHSIDELFNYFQLLDCRIIAYFHNLKFDGSFWLSYLLGKLNYKQAYNEISKDPPKYEWLEDKEMPEKSFKYSISEMGQWYTIKIKVNNHLIEIRDSLKLLPFSVSKIGKSFGTKHKKLEMEYKGIRYAGCEITPEEREYIKNDVLVVKEALEIMYKENHQKLTIGSCCMQEYRKTLTKDEFKRWFPNLFEIQLNEDRYGAKTVGDYIRKSYRGGWCYLVPNKANKIIHNGVTADVNSLYPSVMSLESHNKYPMGKPIFWKGNYIPMPVVSPNFKGYYFIRIRTRFYLKDGYLPCIQVKNDLKYRPNVWLETSDIWNKKMKRYDKFYIDLNGDVQPAKVTLTLTQTDFELIKEHYDLVEMEILDGCYFKYSSDDLFESYIRKYRKIKQESKGAIRELAKLFLNNLYGKMASNTNSSFKVAYLKEDKSLGYITIEEHNKTPGYIPVGSAITSYARNFTIRAAQKNYHPGKRGFIYADTDSIHCDLRPDELIGIEVSDTDFLKWKLESCWDEAIFVRQKTYIEHITHENLMPLQKDKEYYNIKCAGLNTRGKDLFLYSMGDEQTVHRLDDYNTENELEFTEAEKEFISTKRELEDFKIGLEFPGKLIPKNIPGGILLTETTYKLR